MSAMSIFCLSKGHDYASFANTHSQQFILIFRSHEWRQHKYSYFNFFRTNCWREDYKIRVFQTTILIFQLCSRVTDADVSSTKSWIALSSFSTAVIIKIILSFNTMTKTAFEKLSRYFWYSYIPLAILYLSEDCWAIFRNCVNLSQ